MRNALEAAGAVAACTMCGKEAKGNDFLDFPKMTSKMTSKMTWWPRELPKEATGEGLVRLNKDELGKTQFDFCDDQVRTRLSRHARLHGVRQ